MEWIAVSNHQLEMLAQQEPTLVPATLWASLQPVPYRPNQNGTNSKRKYSIPVRRIYPENIGSLYGPMGASVKR